MATKLLYIDEKTGRTTEVESFVMSDFVSSGGLANRPVKTSNSGKLTRDLIPQLPLFVDKIFLTQQDIDNKQISLSSYPIIPEAAVLIPLGGCAQVYGIDFKITENLLQWGGLGLDNFLEAGELITVIY